MAKYIDYVVLKTNKPNSRKTITAFAEEFGYTEHLEKTEDIRSLAIRFSPEDITEEIQNFSTFLNKDTEQYGKDKFKVEIFKITEDKETQHLVRSLELVAGTITLDEKNDIITKLIEKEDLLFDKQEIENSKKNKLKDEQPQFFSNKNKPKSKGIVYKNEYSEAQEINGNTEPEEKPKNNQNNQGYQVQPRHHNQNKPNDRSTTSNRNSDRPNKNKAPQKNSQKVQENKNKNKLNINEKKKNEPKTTIDNEKANRNNPNHPSHPDHPKNPKNMKVNDKNTTVKKSRKPS
jgi:hypothetical protein